MAEDSQSLPLTTTTTTHYKSNEQQQQQKLPIYTNPNTTKPPNKCFIYIFSAFVFLAVAALVFSLIVLRLNSPTILLSSISLSKFSIANTTTANSTSQSLNLILIPDFAVDNSNFGPFNFDSGTVGFLHAGAVVGQSTTGAGRAEAKGTKRMSVTVEANIATNNVSNFGVLNLNLIGFVNLRGRVRLIHVLRKSFSPGIACSVHLDLNHRQILPDWVCE